MAKDDISAEERDILERFERGELRPAPDAEREIQTGPRGGAQHYMVFRRLRR